MSTSDPLYRLTFALPGDCPAFPGSLTAWLTWLILPICCMAVVGLCSSCWAGLGLTEQMPGLYFFLSGEERGKKVISASFSPSPLQTSSLLLFCLFYCGLDARLKLLSLPFAWLGRKAAMLPYLQHGMLVGLAANPVLPGFFATRNHFRPMRQLCKKQSSRQGRFARCARLSCFLLRAASWPATHGCSANSEDTPASQKKIPRFCGGDFFLPWRKHFFSKGKKKGEEREMGGGIFGHGWAACFLLSRFALPGRLAGRPAYPGLLLSTFCLAWPSGLVRECGADF